MSVKNNPSQGPDVSNQDPKSQNRCPECDGSIVQDSVEAVCEDCGAVIDSDPIDHGPEWRSYEDDETNRERTGSPLSPTRHDQGLSTEIGHRVDSNGNTLSSKKRSQLHRLRREHKRSRFRSRRERNLAYGLTEVRRVAGALGLPKSIQKQACQLFQTASDQHLLRGRSIEAIATGSVYAACRCNELPRSLSEFYPVARVDGDRVKHGYRVLNRELSLPTTPIPPTEYVTRIGSKLDLSEPVRRRASNLAERASESQIDNGRNPAGVAAACLYTAANHHDEQVTQAALADAADVSIVTVRNRWEEIKSLDTSAEATDSPGSGQD